MRVCVTDRSDQPPGDLRPAGELAPDVALPWVAKLRAGVLAGLAALILLTHFATGVDLRLEWLAIPIAVMAASNVAAGRLTRAMGVRPALGALLALDTVCLTALLALSGGPANPFTLLYLVQITLSAVILNKGWTWGLGLLSASGYGLLFAVHVKLPVFEAHHAPGDFSAHLTGMWLAFAAGALLITVFIGKVSEALRKREQEVLALQDELARREKLSSVATLAAGAAHELGTPLATIAIASKDLEYYATEVSRDAEIAGDARLIRGEVDRCRTILNRMAAHSAEPMGESPAWTSLEELLVGVVESLAASDQARVRTRAASGAGSVLPPEATRQALAALVRNALDASSPDSPVVLSAEAAAGLVRFEIQDSGCGMSRETLTRVSEPFFTTKEPGRGMGLGTFLVRVFAQRLGGRLVFDSEPGRGSRVTLEFPLLKDDGQREAAGAGR